MIDISYKPISFDEMHDEFMHLPAKEREKALKNKASEHVLSAVNAAYYQNLLPSNVSDDDIFA